MLRQHITAAMCNDQRRALTLRLHWAAGNSTRFYVANFSYYGEDEFDIVQFSSLSCAVEAKYVMQDLLVATGLNSKCEDSSGNPGSIPASTSFRYNNHGRTSGACSSSSSSSNLQSTSGRATCLQYMEVANRACLAVLQYCPASIQAFAM